MPIKIPHSQPSLNAKDAASVAGVFKKKHIAQGKKVLEFEDKASQYCHVKGAVAVNSGTSALHLALLALGVGYKDEVIIPSYVCSALLNACFYVGAIPRIVDVNTDDFNISVPQVKKNITKKTKAIIVPHLFGCPADMKGLLGLGVPIIEDCAQSLGAKYQGRPVGSMGTISICSFYATKVLTTGEGGMVLSNNHKLLDKIRDLREYDNVSSYKVRYNYKMTDIQAVLGINQLARLPQFIRRRQKIAALYDRAFQNFPVIVPPRAAGCDHIYFRYVIKVKAGQKDISQKLKNRGVEAVSPVFKPLHQYFDQKNCPVSDQLMTQCISIPVYPNLTDTQVQYIISCMPGRP